MLGQLSAGRRIGGKAACLSFIRCQLPSALCNGV
jgi:hypothetical protein